MWNVDWQFVFVTLIAFGALLVIVRPLLPMRRSAGSTASGCPSCAAGRAACSRPGHDRQAAPDEPVSLTLVGPSRGPDVERSSRGSGVTRR